jgi:hypothetical protein
MAPDTGGFLAPEDLPAYESPRFYIDLKPGQPLLVGPGVALPATTFPVRPGYVRITTVGGGALMSLDMLTTDEPYLLSDSYAAGWERIPRVGRVDLPLWTGGALIQQVIPVTLHVLKWRGLDIEKEWKALRKLARPPGGGRPPRVQLAGPVDHKEMDWTIVGLDIDPASTRRRGHKMVRQDVTITVQQWLNPDARAALDRTTRAKDAPRRAFFTASMNTVKKVAKHYHVRWQAIRDTPGNKGLGDPDYKHPAGTVVWLPADAQAFSRSRKPGPHGTGGFKAP